MNARNNKYFTMRFRQKVGLNEMRRLTDDFQWGVSLRHVHVRPTMAFFGLNGFDHGDLRSQSAGTGDIWCPTP
jgi:hypothetical protein